MQLNLFGIFFGICIAAGVRHTNAADTYHIYGEMSSSTHRSPYSSSLLCMDIRPQHSVDIEQITGLWYGSEIIMHSQDVPGVYSYNSCVIIHITDITAQMQNRYQQQQQRHELHRQQPQHQQHEPHRQQAHVDYADTRYLRLIWSEKEENLEYTLNYTANSPGLWSSVGEQRGSLASLNHYNQFAGSVQVVKAVNDHLVLTFCGSDLKSSIYTIVLSRTEKGLSPEELRSIRSLLSRRGLYTETIRKVCSSAAAALRASTVLFAAFVTTAFMLRNI